MLFSCRPNTESDQPGVCISFDDQSINEWFELRHLFEENGVLVTFFISEPKQLDSTEIAKLRVLNNDGHEIGFHGNIHVLSEHYIKEYSYSSYLKNEIKDGLAVMDSLQFNCRSFAYPYGAKYWFTDFLLSQTFDHIRSVSSMSNMKELPLNEDVFYSFDGDKTISAVGFDQNSEFNQDVLKSAMEKAKSEQKVFLLYGHTPTENEKLEGYYFSKKRLMNIIETARKLDLSFYRVSDLN